MRQRSLIGRRGSTSLDHFEPVPGFSPHAGAYRAFSTCQWIEGTPEDGSKCGAPARPDSAYCPAHHARAYTPEGEAWPS